MRDLTIIILRLLRESKTSIVRSDGRTNAFCNGNRVIFNVQARVSVFIRGLGHGRARIFTVYLGNATIKTRAGLHEFTHYPSFLLNRDLSFLTKGDLCHAQLVLRTPRSIRVIFSLTTRALQLSVRRGLRFINVIVVYPRVSILSLHPVPVQRGVRRHLVQAPLKLVRMMSVLQRTNRISGTGMETTYQPAMEDELASVVRTHPSMLSASGIIILRVARDAFIAITPEGVAIIMKKTERQNVVRELIPAFKPSRRQVAQRPMMATYRRTKGAFHCSRQLAKRIRKGAYGPIIVMVRTSGVGHAKARRVVIQVQLITTYHRKTHNVRLSRRIHRFLYRR